VNVSSLAVRLGTIGAIGAGAATASTLVYLDNRAQDGAPVDRRIALAAAGVGTLGVVGGTFAARSAEQALHPTLARGGRIAAAVGAGLLGGAILGTLGSELQRAFQGRTRTDAAAERLAQEQARSSTAPSADAATKDAAATRALVDDYQPAPAGSSTRLPASDPRVDIGGATVASAAGAILRAFDSNDTGVVWTGEQQRVVHGRTLSLASAVSLAPRHDDGAVDFAKPSELEDLITAHIDRPDTGTPGTIDDAEAAAWYGPDGIGEKDITWDGEAATVQRLFSEPAVSAEDAAWTLGAYAPKTGPILYLTGVDSEAAARALLPSLVHDDLPAPVLVRLPDGAPSRFGIVSLLRNGERSTDRPDQEAMPTIRGIGSIVAIANKQGVF
jgi:hypothetical protein